MIYAIETTFIDGLYKYLLQKGGDKEGTADIKAKLDEEEYDSEAVMEDIDVLKKYDTTSNIAQFVEAKDEYDGIRDYIYNYKRMILYL